MPASSRATRMLVLLQLLADLLVACSGLRLTNMTAPALQDPRHDMELHCRFDMGGEDLYAVKWYKDDHEFFRYTPTGPEPITKYPVAGVHVDSRRTQCMPEGCDLLLTKLTRPQSSGAYRCEVSSEAPAFRLASQTHNVTVAAVPEEAPRIEGVLETYLLGDLLVAQCASGMGDPKPALTWYINKQQVTSKSVRELPSTSLADPRNERVHLKSTLLQLKLPIDKKLAQSNARASAPLEVTCVSSVEGISHTVSPPKSSTRTVTIVDQHQQVNNQKLHSPFFNGGQCSKGGFLAALALLLVKWWC